MQLSAILLARVIAYIEAFDLSPQGKVFFPEVVAGIVKQYGFQKFPKTLEEFDQSKGVLFLEGKAGNRIIQKFGIWNNILVLETRSNTTDSKLILEEMLDWGVGKFGITYKPGSITRFAYVSNLTFHTDIPILSGNSAITRLADAASKAVSDVWQEAIQYEPISFFIGHDPLARKYAIAPFTIQRRSEVKFSENKYFSEAPLPTHLHLKLLEQYESDVLKGVSKQ